MLLDQKLYDVGIEKSNGVSVKSETVGDEGTSAVLDSCDFKNKAYSINQIVRELCGD